jgi:hypothetical protein
MGMSFIRRDVLRPPNGQAQLDHAGEYREMRPAL